MPQKYVTDPVLRRLFAQIASTRKDVECTFGRIKNRFRMLKLPLMFDDIGDVRALFTTGCVLHNMLLEHDRADVWNEADGVHSPEVIGRFMCAYCCFIDLFLLTYSNSSSRHFSSHGVACDVQVHADTDVTGVGGLQIFCLHARRVNLMSCRHGTCICCCTFVFLRRQHRAHSLRAARCSCAAL